MKIYVRASSDREEQEVYYTLGEEIEKSLIDAGIAAHLKSVWKDEFSDQTYRWVISFRADTEEDCNNAVILISNTPEYHDRFGGYTFGYHNFDCQLKFQKPDN